MIGTSVARNLSVCHDPASTRSVCVTAEPTQQTHNAKAHQREGLIELRRAGVGAGRATAWNLGLETRQNDSH